jgi:hypothetical protein
MKNKTHKRLPKILRINRISKKHLKISVLFSNGEDRILDFDKIFKKEWKVTKGDPEYKLLTPSEFAKVKVESHTLSWNNIDLFMTGLDGKKKKVPFEVGADTLYSLSEVDEKLEISLGALFRDARLKAKLSQDDVAKLSGTSRTYISSKAINKM